MFTVPEGRTFWQAFSDHVTLFNKHTSHLGGRKLYSLTVDPVGMLNSTIFFVPSKRSRLDERGRNHIKYSLMRFPLYIVDLYFKVRVVLSIVFLIPLFIMFFHQLFTNSCLCSHSYNKSVQWSLLVKFSVFLLS
jgi:hypothetical protein